MKFSIIIPVHNSAEYLEKCLTSWQAQTYGDFEVICVENGSTDNSFDILRNFEKKDKRFRVYHIDMAGVSHARNVGMRYISGDVFGFCDSDDYVRSDYLEAASKLFEMYNADCVITGVRPVRGGETDRVAGKSNKETLLSSKDVLCKILCDKRIGGFAWNKLFKVSSVKPVPWNETFFCYEDLLWNVEMLYKNQLRVVHSTRCFYFYVQRSESVSHSLEYMYDKNGVLNLIHVLEKIKPCYDGDGKKERAWISEFCYSEMENVYCNPRMPLSIKRGFMQDFQKNRRFYFGNADRPLIEKMKTVVKLLIIYFRRNE